MMKHTLCILLKQRCSEYFVLPTMQAVLSHTYVTISTTTACFANWRKTAANAGSSRTPVTNSRSCSVHAEALKVQPNRHKHPL